MCTMHPIQDYLDMWEPLRSVHVCMYVCMYVYVIRSVCVCMHTSCDLYMYVYMY